MRSLHSSYSWAPVFLRIRVAPGIFIYFGLPGSPCSLVQPSPWSGTCRRSTDFVRFPSLKDFLLLVIECLKTVVNIPSNFLVVYARKARPVPITVSGLKVEVTFSVGCILNLNDWFSVFLHPLSTRYINMSGSAFQTQYVCGSSFLAPICYFSFIFSPLPFLNSFAFHCLPDFNKWALVAPACNILRI